MLKKKVPLVTALLVLYYLITYIFQRGVASYYGFPVIFISVDMNCMLNVGVSLILLSFCMAGALNLDFFSKELGFKAWFLLFVSVISVAYIPFLGMYPKSYLVRNSIGSVSLYMLFFSLALVAVLYVACSIKHRTVVMAIRSKVFYLTVSIFLLSYSSGWLYAFRFSSPVSVGDDYYLVASYSDYYIVANCQQKKATYRILRLDENALIKKVDNKVKDEIKLCLWEAN